MPCAREQVRALATARRGFTLIELLVALLLSAVVAGVTFTFLTGQSQFARLQTAREEVQQNARVALELMSSELRGASAAAIVSAGTSSLRFRVPRAWGLLCSAVATGDSTEVWVRFPPDVFPDDFEPAKKRWGLAVAQTTDPLEAPVRWRFVPGLDGAAGANPCGALNPATDALERGFGGRGFFLAGAGIPRVAAGSLAYIYEEVSYDVAAGSTGSAGAGRHWLRRSIGIHDSGAPAPQPLVGPLPEANGLLLTYYRSDGSVIAAPVAAGELASIALVEIQLLTLSRSRFAGRPQEARLSSRVHLRN